MQVEVVDGLATMLSSVNDHTVSFAKTFVARNFRSGLHKMAEESTLASIGFFERADMLAGHNEDVNRRLGIDVGESVSELVLMDCGGWNLAFDDLAEETTHGVDSVHGRCAGLKAVGRVASGEENPALP